MPVADQSDAPSVLLFLNVILKLNHKGLRVRSNYSLVHGDKNNLHLTLFEKLSVLDHLKKQEAAELQDSRDVKPLVGAEVLFNITHSSLSK